MDLKERVVAEQVVQFVDGVAIAFCSLEMPLQFDKLHLVIRAGAVIVIDRGFNFFKVRLHAALARSQQATYTTQESLPFYGIRNLVISINRTPDFLQQPYEPIRLSNL